MALSYFNKISPMHIGGSSFFIEYYKNDQCAIEISQSLLFCLSENKSTTPTLIIMIIINNNNNNRISRAPIERWI